VSIPARHDAAVVTTALSRGPDLIARAKEVGAACGLPYMRRRSIPDGTPNVVIEAGGAHLVVGDAAVRSHPGMGLVRLRRLIRGEERDPIVDIGELREGDHVLDATMGFGQDTLVAAYAAGATGRVVGIESSAMLVGLLLAGRAGWPRPSAEIMSRVEVIHGNSRDYLRAAAPGSFDVVYLDPMFRRPRPAAPDFAVLRLLADMSPLTEEDLAVARFVGAPRSCSVGSPEPDSARVGDAGRPHPPNAPRTDWTDRTYPTAGCVDVAPSAAPDFETSGFDEAFQARRTQATAQPPPTHTTVPKSVNARRYTGGSVCAKK
jgi:SAM-dependent methyltransferase